MPGTGILNISWILINGTWIGAMINKIEISPHNRCICGSESLYILTYEKGSPALWRLDAFLRLSISHQMFLKIIFSKDLWRYFLYIFECWVCKSWFVKSNGMNRNDVFRAEHRYTPFPRILEGDQAARRLAQQSCRQEEVWMCLGHAENGAGW